MKEKDRAEYETLFFLSLIAKSKYQCDKTRSV